MNCELNNELKCIPPDFHIYDDYRHIRTKQSDNKYETINHKPCKNISYICTLQCLFT